MEIVLNYTVCSHGSGLICYETKELFKLRLKRLKGNSASLEGPINVVISSIRCVSVHLSTTCDVLHCPTNEQISHHCQLWLLCSQSDVDSP